MRGGTGQEKERIEEIEAEDEVMIVDDRNAVSMNARPNVEVPVRSVSKFRSVVSDVKSKISLFNSKTETGGGDPVKLCAKVDAMKTVKVFRLTRKDLLKFDQYQILCFSLGPPLTPQQQVAMKEITSTPIMAS